MADDSTQPANEAHAVREFQALVRAPIYWGRGVPRGSGGLVLVVPGLFGNDLYLQPMRNWLSRLGYRPALSSLAFNAGCPRRLVEQVQRALAVQAPRGELAIVGHSRGGMLGKALLHRLDDRVTRFIAIGSPIGGVLRHGIKAMTTGATNPLTRQGLGAAVAETGRRLTATLDPNCNVPECDCEYVGDVTSPLPQHVRATAIYSKNDPVVPADAARIDGATNVSVTGTHSGLVYNVRVFEALAKALSA